MLFDTARPEWQALLNPVNNLVYNADGRSVHTVIVDGRVVVDAYRQSFVDEARLFAKVQEIGERLQARTGDHLPALALADRLRVHAPVVADSRRRRGTRETVEPGDEAHGCPPTTLSGDRALDGGRRRPQSRGARTLRRRRSRVPGATRTRSSSRSRSVISAIKRSRSASQCARSVRNCSLSAAACVGWLALRVTSSLALARGVSRGGQRGRAPTPSGRGTSRASRRTARRTAASRRCRAWPSRRARPRSGRAGRPGCPR